MKPCSRCGATKLLSEFGVSKQHKSGLFNICKTCYADRRKEWASNRPEARRKCLENNFDKVRAWRKEYRKRTSVRALQQQRERYAKTPDIFRQRANEYQKKNKSKVLEQDKKERLALVDAYVATLLGLKVSDVPKPLLEMKRQQISILRLARQLKKAANETS